MKQRIASIDIVRGLAMILMALDHVRDFMHAGAFTDDPLNVATTTPGLFFTRWITHLCAPIFLFLAGVSVYLQGTRKPRKALAYFLIKRGLWFIIAEWTIIALGWTFNPFFNLIPLQVIWAIGASMVILGACLLAGMTPFALLSLGGVIVLGHNLLDIPESAPGFEAGFWWNLLHHGAFVPYKIGESRYLFIVYTFPVWTGVMMLGYGLGKWFNTQLRPSDKRKRLLLTGGGLILFFILLRASNWYGDPVDWSAQANGMRTLLSFLNVNKYPPSLLYLSLMLGLMFVLLAYAESLGNQAASFLSLYGRTAFFYYILHIYLIHAIATICFFARGHTMDEAIQFAQQLPFLFVLPGEGFSLIGVYGMWVLVVLGLYPLCRWYDRYKIRHPEKWWLSYL